MTYQNDIDWISNECKTLNCELHPVKKSTPVWVFERDLFRMLTMFCTFLMTMVYCYGEVPGQVYIDCPYCESQIDLEQLQEKSWWMKEDNDWVCDNSYCDNRDKLSRDNPCPDCDKYKNEKYNRNKAERHGGKKRNKK